MMFLVLAWLLERLFGWRARSHRDEVVGQPSAQPPAPTTAALEAALEDDLTVRLRGVPIGEPDLGGWCDTCLLPSAISQQIAVDVLDSETVVGIWVVEGCTNGCRPMLVRAGNR